MPVCSSILDFCRGGNRFSDFNAFYGSIRIPSELAVPDQGLNEFSKNTLVVVW